MKSLKIFRSMILISIFVGLTSFCPFWVLAKNTDVVGIWDLVAQGISVGCTEHTPCGGNIPPYNRCGTDVCGFFQMGDPYIHVSQSGTVIRASGVDCNGHPYTLDGVISGNSVTFTIQGNGITPGIGPATTTYTGTLDGNTISGNFSGYASWTYEDENGNLITETATWTGTFTVIVLRPVLLIHGIWSSGNAWQEWGVKQLLEENGYVTNIIEFCPNNGNIEDEAMKIGEKIFTLLAENPTGSFDLVAHSMGGLAARWYLTHPELWPSDEQGVPKHRIRKLITLGTPHSGTDIHLLHPIFANLLEYKSKYWNGCSNNYYYESDPYHFNIWSPGLQEMTAIWKPPTTWRSEPMPNLERNLPYIMMSIDSTPYEWLELEELFPPVPYTRTCFKNHEDYYDRMINTLTGGSNLSPFLEELNAIPHPSDVEYYLLYGLNRLIPIDIGPTHVTFIGDYGDGIVPWQSAAGKGLLFPNAVRVPVINANHLDIPAKSKYLILQYLNK